MGPGMASANYRSRPTRVLAHILVALQKYILASSLRPTRKDFRVPLKISQTGHPMSNRRPWGLGVVLAALGTLHKALSLLLRVDFMDTLSNYYVELAYVWGERICKLPPIVVMPLGVVCVSVCLSICLSVFLSVYVSVCLSVCLSVHLSVCPSVCLMSVLCLSASLCLYTYVCPCAGVPAIIY